MGGWLPASLRRRYRELALLGNRVLLAPASVPQGWAMVPMRHEDAKGLVMHDNHLPLFAIPMV
jgi:hypothetical protein